MFGNLKEIIQLLSTLSEKEKDRRVFESMVAVAFQSDFYSKTH